VIQRRGSARRFRRTPIPLAALHTLLELAARPFEADFLPPGGALTSIYLIVNAVDGLAPGAYRYAADARALEPLRLGQARALAGHLALDQPLAADAAVDVVFMADLERVLGRLGNRGYRAAQLEGGIRGGKLYLGAYALGLSATGLTFYDDEMTALFSPSAAGQSPMFLVALGERAPL
jgi:SagB-type dehydrogenase family enzyme